MENGVLRFNISNAGDDEFTIKNWQLPWSDIYPFATVLSVHSVDRDTNRIKAIGESVFMFSAVTDNVSIGPGETLSDDIRLQDRFPEMVIDGTTRYVVYWTYGLNRCDQGIALIVSGAVYFDEDGSSTIFQDTKTESRSTACKST